MSGSKCFNLHMHKHRKPKSPYSSPDHPPTPTTPTTPATDTKTPLPIQIQGSHDLRQVFDKYDSNGDGKISSSEQESVLRTLGNPDPVSEAASMMHAADIDGDGYIGYEEFLSVNRMEKDEGRCVEDLKEAFMMYDKDGNGMISAGELHDVLQRVVGERATLAHCEDMIKAVDSNGNGTVSFEDFVGMMRKSLA